MEKIIKTLWVDDKIIELNQDDAYSLEAEEYGVQLFPFDCWEKAKIELTNHYDDYSAIILDAKCKLRVDDVDSTLRFLPEVLKQLALMAIEKHRTIPWFILSAGSGDVGPLDWVKEPRLAWDDWEKDFYSKAVDKPELFSRIPEIAVHSNATQIKTILYKDVFESLDSFKGVNNENTKRVLVEVLTALHFMEGDFKPILYYNQLRQVLEYLFKVCHNVGLVPDQCIELDGRVNLAQSSKYLAGRVAEHKGVRYGIDGDRIVTPNIESEIKSILFLGNNNSHFADLDDESRRMVEDFFRTSNSRYVIFSLALQMCDIIVWFRDYIAQHNDKDMNLSKCKQVGKDDKANYEGKEFYPEKDENGYWHCGDCSVPIRSIHIGKKIKLRNVTDNTDLRTKQFYKYFAYYDVV